MYSLDLMRKEVKKYIETADEKVVKMMHAMFEVNADEDWWDTMPDNVRSDVEEALSEADKGELILHEEIKKRYQKWLAK